MHLHVGLVSGGWAQEPQQSKAHCSTCSVTPLMQAQSWASTIQSNNKNNVLRKENVGGISKHKQGKKIHPLKKIKTCKNQMFKMAQRRLMQLNFQIAGSKARQIESNSNSRSKFKFAKKSNFGKKKSAMPLVYFGLTSSKKEVLRFGHKEKPDGKFGLFGVGSLVHPQAWARPPCQTDTPMVMGEQPNPNTGHPLTSNPSYIEPWAWVKKKLKDVSSILRTIPQKGFK